MSPIIVSAIITASATLLAAILTVYFHVIHKPQQAAGGAANATGLAARATEEAGQLVSHIPFERDESVPFDSDLMFARSGDRTIIKMPRGGGMLFHTFFMSGWLIGWTAGIFFVGSEFFSLVFGKGIGGDSEWNWFAPLFTFGWLVGAIAAEFAVINSLFRVIARAFGRRYLVLEPDVMIDLCRILTLNLPKLYFRKHIKNLRVEPDGVVFEYGKNDIKLDGITRVEAEWVRRRLRQPTPGTA
ncbi:MAG TPA: hypothetical protein VKI44_29150 [Acetobacteraceae bacterium]|nr:hypothetical protein [Acetobacteraceae bacterium]